MRSIVFTSKDQSELELLKKLAEKLGVSTYELTEEDKEDLGLYAAMLEERKGDYVSEKEIFNEFKK